MTKWPSQKKLNAVRKKLEKGHASKPLAKNALPVDKVKYHICEQFVIFKNNTKITQKALAQKIDIDESIISKILHYHIEEFTIDRLVKFLAILYPGLEVKIEIAA